MKFWLNQIINLCKAVNWIKLDIILAVTNTDSAVSQYMINSRGMTSFHSFCLLHIICTRKYNSAQKMKKMRIPDSSLLHFSAQLLQALLYNIYRKDATGRFLSFTGE